MPRSVTLALALASLALLAPSAATLAASPGPSLGAPAGDHDASAAAVAAVRAMDPRFADLPTRFEQQVLMSQEFDWAHLLAASWIGVLPTIATTFDVGPDVDAWVDTGMGRFVEVQLVAGCPGTLREYPVEDPCEWRHSFVYLVSPAGVPTLVVEAGDPIDVS